MKNIDVVCDFDIKFLGSFYQPDKTVFRVYAPDYENMTLVMNGEHYPMNKEEGCFEITVEGDLELARYHYECDGDVSFRDPFSYMSDEKDSYVLDKNKFLKEIYVPKNLDCDPIIYEISIRDFSCDESYTGKYHRKFLSLTESGLKKDGYSIGLDYIKQLGISHLQLMPIFDFDNDKTDKKGRMIRQERYSGSMQRSFYVGDAITEEDVKAAFKHGVLSLTIPKKEKAKLPEKKTILIEG